MTKMIKDIPLLVALNVTILQLEKMLISLLGTKVVINKNKNGSGKINIEFYSESDLQRVLEILTENDE